MVWNRESGYETKLKYSKLSEKLQEEIQKYESMEKYLESEFGDSYAAAIEVHNTNYSEINKTYKNLFGLDKNMKFDIVVGNPPYQLNDNGKRENGTVNASASAIYPDFFRLLYSNKQTGSR